jgi:hypothetical protein
MENDYKKSTLSPRELSKYDREKKLMQMQKYKQDLDQFKM